MALTLETSLEAVLGAATARAMEKAWGYTTTGELLGHYPRRYASRGELTPIRGLPIGEQVTIVAEILQSDTRRMKNRAGSILEVVIGDGHGQMKLTFFSIHPHQKTLTPGKRGQFSGKVSVFNHTLQLTHPEYELFDHDDFTNTSEWVSSPLPIYPATKAVTSWKTRRAISTILDGLGEVADPMPERFAAEHRYLGARDALERIHRPKEDDDWRVARHTLRMHEALLLQTALLQQRAFVRTMSSTKRPAGDILRRFDAELPFELTPDQRSVGDQVAADLVAEWPMNRLVQGEVGSGKTLVALRAMLQVAQSGGQSALIAPTEVLAAQHLRSIAKMLGPKLAPELMPTLLTGQMPAAERRKASLRVASGQARIVIGTHALLSETTTFADLGLVVVDEQHRFGVEQRETLRAKGSSPHALVLTATPIPRTVAMTVFGDLDVSTIRTMPSGRPGIESFVVPGDNAVWFHRVWDRAEEEILKGRQVFVVCAAIDAMKKSSEDVEAPLVEGEAPNGPRWGVEQVAQLLARHPQLSKRRFATLHGKMPSDVKDQTMRAFASADLDILIATTVIEVGVDVPNASTMIVLDADRFGVSQLHQIRGRVGRGSVPGLCLLVSEAPPGSPAIERVQAVASTLDGFELAVVDLELRGEGDVLGDAQSGARSSLKLLRVVKDGDVIEEARAEAERILAEDPTLLHHRTLAEALSRHVTQEERAALRKS